MGKISTKTTFSSTQKVVFDSFAKDKNLSKKFYFTGGTALSAVYLHHRESEDLDFFSETDFDNEEIISFVERVASLINTQPRITLKERVRIFELVDDHKNLVIKIDFGYYPHLRLEKGKKVQGVEVDSLVDISANKLATLLQRTDIKDFVDLFFLLKKYTIWDLLHWSQQKFKLEIDLVWLGAGFVKVEQFDYLPKMLVPLDLAQLNIFYKDLAVKIADKAVKA